MLKVSPATKHADVPMTSEDCYKTLTGVCKSIFRLSAIENTVYSVNNFVRLATSRRSFSNRPKRAFFVVRSRTTHASAETGGAGLSINIFVSFISDYGKLERSTVAYELICCSFLLFLLYRIGCADLFPPFL